MAHQHDTAEARPMERIDQGPEALHVVALVQGQRHVAHAVPG